MRWLFEEFCLDARRRELSRRGEPVRLEPQVFDLLEYLVAHRERLVTRDDLIASVWEGRVVSESTLATRINAARAALGDSGEQQRLIKTIPRRGLRFVGAVREEAEPTVVDAAPPPRIRLRTASVAAAVLAAALIVAGAPWWVGSRETVRSGTPMPQPEQAALAPLAGPARSAPRMSLAVLPFANSDGDPELDRLADAASEDLAITFGRYPGWLVIGHGVVLPYRNHAVDLRQVGRELGVRYALQGGVRRSSGEQISINAQLVDTATGAQLWGELFELPPAGLAEFRRLVSGRVQRPLSFAMIAAESRRSRAERPEDPDTVDLVLRGRDLWIRPGSPEGYAEARRLFERAIALDETNADAHMALGGLLVTNVSRSRSTDPQGDLEEADRHLARALALDPSHIWAHFRRGMLFALRWRFEEALLQMEIVLARNPSYAPGYSMRGYVRLLMGRPEEAVADIEEAFRLSPQDPWRESWFHVLGFAHVMLHRDEDAVRHFRRAAAERTIADAVELGASRMHLAAMLALTGRVEEARALLREVQPTLSSCGTIACMTPRYMRWSPDPRYRAMRERLLEGLRIAGMPDE